MTSTQLRERIAAAEKKVENKKATIEKKFKWIESGKKNEFEVKYLREDITRLRKEIEETLNTIAKYNEQLNKADAAEMTYYKMPQIMRDLEARLAAEWTESDIAKRESLYAEYKKLGEIENYSERREAFHRFYSNHAGATNMMHKTDDEIAKNAAKDARAYVLDLFARVEQITGEITDVRNITCAGVALNGFIKGKEGSAKVETILAGGYNIQRLHCRTLVHAY